MMLIDVYKVPITASLLLIALVIAGSIILSLRRPPTSGATPGGTRDGDGAAPAAVSRHAA